MLYPGQSFVRMPVNDASRDFFISDLHGFVEHLEVLRISCRSSLATVGGLTRVATSEVA